jgi:polar amino acid transport system substrate-binding protein
LRILVLWFGQVAKVIMKRLGIWAPALAAVSIVALSASAFGQLAPGVQIAVGTKLRCGMIAIRVLGGVANPVCQFIADKLGVSLEPVMYSSPDAYPQSFDKGEWDVAVGPRVLAPSDKADVTADLWLIPLIYVAAPGHSFADASQVDRPGVKIGTIQGSPSDRYLSHSVKAAELVRIPLSAHISADAADLLKSGKADVFGADSGVGYPAVEVLAGAKIVPGAFNTVRVAAALPKGRSDLAQKTLSNFVSEAKRTGVVQKAIDQQNLKGVRVAD